MYWDVAVFAAYPNGALRRGVGHQSGEINKVEASSNALISLESARAMRTILVRKG